MTDYLVMTHEVSKVMQSLYPVTYPEIMKGFNLLKNSIGLVLFDEIENLYVIGNDSSLEMDSNNNIIVINGTQQILCNNIQIICDITNYLNFASKEYDAQKLKIVKYFFVNLMRYSLRIRDELLKKLGIAVDDTKGVIFRIDGYYYFDIESLEKGLKIK